MAVPSQAFPRTQGRHHPNSQIPSFQPTDTGINQQNSDAPFRDEKGTRVLNISGRHPCQQGLTSRATARQPPPAAAGS